jgi:hypothetical protein
MGPAVTPIAPFADDRRGGTGRAVATAATYVITFLVFLGIYALLQRRARRRGATTLEPRRAVAWIAIITACAAVAILVGVVAG